MFIHVNDDVNYGNSNNNNANDDGIGW
jgi:hypothetical protein